MNNSAKIAEAFGIEMLKPKAEIYKTLVLSTMHVSTADLNKLVKDKERPIVRVKAGEWVDPRVYVELLTSGNFDVDLQENRETLVRYYPSIEPVLKAALLLGCHAVEFDPDGIVYENLPVYDAD